MTWHKQMKKHKNTAKTMENGTWRHLAAFQARLDAPLGRCLNKNLRNATSMRISGLKEYRITSIRKLS